jgi:50S ribosomal protein L16 3-hydroxylase
MANFFNTGLSQQQFLEQYWQKKPLRDQANIATRVNVYRHLAQVSSNAFLANEQNHLHLKPLLIRQAFPDFVSPISPEELAGLACEDEIESRLIEE